ncbi:MAG: hypothetical protein KTR30_08285, partial [Saprospiraceae bacterium]|nr:hypothetical protein [Saprospiraceae bacterium]
MKISLVNKANSADLEQELSWFRQVIDTRLKLHFGQESNHLGVFDLKPPEFGESASNWANFLRRYQPSMIERLTILLALAPSIAPRILDIFLVKNAQIDDYFTEFGGLVQPAPRGFSPTRETLFFLVGGERLDLRFETMQLFQAGHYFWTDNILSSPTPSLAAPAGSPILGVSTSFLEDLTHTQSQTDVLESHFAVQKIQTKLAWEDLELLPRTINQLKDIENWLSHGDTLLNDWG